MTNLVKEPTDPPSTSASDSHSFAHDGQRLLWAFEAHLLASYAWVPLLAILPGGHPSWWVYLLAPVVLLFRVLSDVWLFLVRVLCGGPFSEFAWRDPAMGVAAMKLAIYGLLFALSLLLVRWMHRSIRARRGNTGKAPTIDAGSTHQRPVHGEGLQLKTNRRRRIWRVVWGVATILGIVGIASGFWPCALHPLIFDETGDFRTDGIFRTLSPLLLRLDSFLSSEGPLLSVLLLTAGLAGLVFTTPVSEVPGARRPRRFVRAALAVVLSSHALVLLVSLPLFLVPAGQPVRAMGWALLVSFIAGVNFVLAVPLGALAMWKDKAVFLGGIALILGLTMTPSWFARFLLHFAAAVKGFYLSP